MIKRHGNHQSYYRERVWTGILSVMVLDFIDMIVSFFLHIYSPQLHPRLLLVLPTNTENSTEQEILPIYIFFLSTKKISIIIN